MPIAKLNSTASSSVYARVMCMVEYGIWSMEYMWNTFASSQSCKGSARSLEQVSLY